MSEAPTDREVCIVLMPFGNADGTEAERKARVHYDLVFDHVIAPSVQAAGLAAVRVDRTPMADEPIRERVQRLLRTAPVAVVDVSGNNPNVFFELGFRVGRNRPFVCISDIPGSYVFWGGTYPIEGYGGADAVQRIADRIRAAYARLNRAETAVSAIGDAVASALRDGCGPFVDKLIAMRLLGVERQIDQARTGRWQVPILEPATYIAQIFTEIIRNLSVGDSYMTVTNVEFWSDGQMGTTAFFAENVSAAVRGVQVQRVVLLDARAIRSSDAAFRTALDVLKELLRAGEEVRRQDGKGNIEVKALLSEHYAEDFTNYRHFASLRLGGETLPHQARVCIVPHHREDVAGGQISRLEVTFRTSDSPADDGEIRGAEARFERAWKRAAPISADVDLAAFLRPPRARPTPRRPRTGPR